LRRLVALQIKEPLKYLEKNIPDLQKMAAAYMGLGTLEELREQIIDVALDRAFLAEPLPTDEAAFKRRIDEGRGTPDADRAGGGAPGRPVLAEYGRAQRKLKDSRPPKEVADDIQAQLQRLVPKRFMLARPGRALQHLPRYLKAVTLRLDKLRGRPGPRRHAPGRAAPAGAALAAPPGELKGSGDARLDEYRWLLEELRVSLFAQELRTPQPVSAKRLDRAWAQLVS
jgi:ATP-dependent helicase HrpA